MPSFLTPTAWDGAAVDAVAPQTSANGITIYDNHTAGSAFAKFDAANSRLQVDKLAELTASNGIVVGSHLKLSADNTLDIGASGTALRAIYAHAINGPTVGTWTPSYGAAGSMTIGSVTTSYARYSAVGKRVFISLYFTGTVGGTVDEYLTVTLPVNTGAINNGQYCPVVIQMPSSAPEIGYAWFGPSVNHMRLYRTGGNDWAAGASWGLITASYESA